jgi:GNAT superfamily N-acetyltransferase|tara:strand:- start:111 stop:599 length:489 start_codon:yes stop_codon:yes gene_type:complete
MRGLLTKPNIESFSLVVRDITHSDIDLFYDGMVDLLKSHLEWHDFDSKKFKSWLERAVDDPDTDTLLCFDGNAPAGYYVARTVTPIWSNERISSDVVLYVLEPYRGKGAAVALLRQWISNLKERGVKKALSGFSLRASEDHARDAYLRSGFSRLGEIYAKRL